MDGFLLIDKPEGITSHDVVDRLRRVTGVRRIGHAGTLDPFATGLLIVGVGRGATKRLSEIMGKDKIYEAVAALGATSDTQDKTGIVTERKVKREVRKDGAWPNEAEVKKAMAAFTGRISQVPPMYSAKKVGGRKLYELARAGQEIERKPVEVTIREFAITEYSPPRLGLRVRCSSGTYVRTLAHDLGAALGTGAYLEELRRTAIGDFRVENALKLDAVTAENWQASLQAL